MPAAIVRIDEVDHLTAAGEALVDAARHVLASAADAVDEATRAGSGRIGRLIIGFSTAAGSVPMVRAIIRRFTQSAPGIDIRLVEHDFSDPAVGPLGPPRAGICRARSPPESFPTARNN